MAGNAPKTAGRRFAMLHAVVQPGTSDNPATFEETWKSWEHQVDVHENLSSSNLDDDVRISVVLREARQKLRDHLLVNSQQFESNNIKRRAIIQAHLNTNNTWIVNDFRETDPMEVDYIGKGNAKARLRAKATGKEAAKAAAKTTARARVKARAKTATKARTKATATAKATAAENLRKTKSATCAETGSRRTRLLVTSQPRQDGEPGRS